MEKVNEKKQACIEHLQKIFKSRLALINEGGHLHPAVPRVDRTRRALVRRVLRELYKEEGPRGYPDEIVLRAVNDRLGDLGLKPVSQSTMRRARRDEYGW